MVWYRGYEFWHPPPRLVALRELTFTVIHFQKALVFFLWDSDTDYKLVLSNYTCFTENISIFTEKCLAIQIDYRLLC